MNKSLLVKIFGSLIIITALAFFIISIIGNKQKLTIELINNIGTVNIYKLDKNVSNDGAPMSDNQKPTKTVSTSTTLELKKGTYRIVYPGSNQYAPQSETIELGNEPENAVINPAYTDEKLKQLLETEKTSIDTALAQKYPIINSGYTVDTGVLLEQGNWYITRLYNRSAKDKYGYYDKYIVVMKKDNNQWVSAVKQPDLVISSVAYPEIPQSVIDISNSYN